MDANVETRKPLTEKQVVRAITLVLAQCAKAVEAEQTLESKNVLDIAKGLFDHLIEVTTEQGGVIATLEYKPLPPKNPKCSA